jgi:diguanylate cyclase (GGDEF)-like protein
MANDAFLIDWVNSGENDLEPIKNYLEMIKSKYAYTSTFFVSEQTRNYYYSDGILKKISVDDPHDIWYFNFKELNVPVDLDVDNDEAKNGLLTVFINHSLIDTNDDFLGVTGVGLEFTQIAEKFRDYENQFDHKIYMVDRDGLIQIHSDRALVETTNIKDIEGIKEISEEILSPSEEIWIGEYEDSKSKKAISVRYIQEFDWFLIVEKDEDESLTTARASLVKNIGIGAIIATGVSLVIYNVIKRFNEHLQFLASSDELTKILNRRSFLPYLKKAISRAARTQKDASLLMIDIDDFKSVNDQYGHFIGDELLVKVVKAINGSLRSNDFIVRWGGDEFCVFLSNSDLDIALKIAERIQKAIENAHVKTKNGEVINRTVSIGLAVLTDSGLSAEKFIKNADDALIEAKKGKKNAIAVFSSN